MPKHVVAGLMAAFAGLRVFFTAITLPLDPALQRHGLARSVPARRSLLDRQLESLEYGTFMLQ
ncbi:hypothetical protein ACQKRQ_05375 [Paraburkholderia sp. NPDC080076]|uniref:hypothetical protein n=1 Tax=Paraburkholderia sp. NPDC080076 TaxID=3390605 RepID=UPI003CFDFD82